MLCAVPLISLYAIIVIRQQRGIVSIKWNENPHVFQEERTTSALSSDLMEELSKIAQVTARERTANVRYLELAQPTTAIRPR